MAALEERAGLAHGGNVQGVGDVPHALALEEGRGVRGRCRR